MSLTFDIYFNSGSASGNHYTTGDNVLGLNITNTDQTYFQQGKLSMYNVPSTQTIGDRVLVLINDDQQFNGYVARVQSAIEGGKLVSTYQIIGKTYDLFRYVTDTTDTSLSGTTAYIASSLVSQYCTGISGGGIDVSQGVDLSNGINLANKSVGDALVELTRYDGYKFYVDNNNDVQYYFPNTQDVAFTVFEEDILQMSPIEEADEDLCNDCRVVGGSTSYTETTEVSTTHPSSTTIPSGVLVAQSFNAEDARLNAMKLYLNRTQGDYSPDSLNFEIWENTERTLFNDPFDNHTYIETSSNVHAKNGYLEMIDSSQGWGTATTFEYTDGCRYMKVDLQGTTSGSYIYISGTQSGASNYQQLTDNEWYDFGFEWSSCKVKYTLSSNGDFTPKIALSNVVISDESGGFEETLFEDTFDDYTYLTEDTAKRDYMTIADGKLLLSGSIGGETFTRADDGHDYDGYYWGNDAASYDGNTGTYANHEAGGGAQWWSCWWWWSFPHSVSFQKIKTYTSHSSIQFRMKDFYVSQQGSGKGWMRTRFDGQYVNMVDGGWNEFNVAGDGKYYYDIDAITCIVQYETNKYGGSARIHDMGVLELPEYNYSGTIRTKLQTPASNFNVDYIKIEPQNPYLSYQINYSGSADSGANWTKLTPNVNTQVTAGNEVLVEYYLIPSGTRGSLLSSSTFLPQTPTLDGCNLVVWKVATGGLPKSGTKLEWSDDVTFRDGDVPYPPDWTEWKSYTSPKLRMTENDTYWLMLSYPSSDSKYWDISHDPNSTYNGKIAYSWDNGVNWSSNSTCPELVPTGNMSFQLAWSESVEGLSYRASNQTSIDIYGRRFKVINDSSLNTSELVQARAEAEVSGSETLKKKGTIVIAGRTDLTTEDTFYANLTNFGIQEELQIVSYTQTIDQRGFTTTLNYGVQPFDLVKHVADLEEKVYSSE